MVFVKGQPKPQKVFAPYTSTKFKHRAEAQRKHTKKPGKVSKDYAIKTKLTDGVDFLARGKKFNDGRKKGFDQLKENEKNGWKLSRPQEPEPYIPPSGWGMAKDERKWNEPLGFNLPDEVNI